MKEKGWAAGSNIIGSEIFFRPHNRHNNLLAKGKSNFICGNHEKKGSCALFFLSKFNVTLPGRWKGGNWADILQLQAPVETF